LNEDKRLKRFLNRVGTDFEERDGDLAFTGVCSLPTRVVWTDPVKSLNASEISYVDSLR